MSELPQAHQGVSRILATTQQTRFHLPNQSAASGITVTGIDLAVVAHSENPDEALRSSASGTHVTKKKKGKAGRGQDILENAELKLENGVSYGLVGRNGSGKSTLLRALSDRIIPGLPRSIRVTRIQQINVTLTSDGNAVSKQPQASLSVLQFMLQSDEARSSVARDLEALSGGDGEDITDPSSQLHRYRQFRYQKMQAELLELQNEATLKSGARGAEARKELRLFEIKVADAESQMYNIPDDMESLDVLTDLRDSTELIDQLHVDLKAMSLVDLEQKARSILTGLGFDEEMMQKRVDRLSGGWRMRCALAAVLFQTADLMLLDEPTNFLDLSGILWLQQHLRNVRNQGQKTVVAVSHDRDFIDGVCQQLIVLKDKTLTYFAGNLSEYEIDLHSRIKYLKHMQETQDKEADRMQKTIRANIKQGKKTGDDNKLRMAKSRQKKLEDRAGMQVSATGGRFKLSRDRAGFHDSKLAAIAIPSFEAGISMMIPQATELRNPGALVSVEKIRHKYKQSSKFILDSVDLVVYLGERIGIMGLNGSGKSTLVKILTDTLKPTSGQVTFHPRLKLGYFSQHAVEELQTIGSENVQQTALGLLSAEAGDEMSEQEIRALLGSYGLPGQLASHTPIVALSGGQLVRAALARMLWNHPNLLVLDEVSTHLDYYTVTALADALADYDGALILVSHDRYLVRRLIEGVRDEDSDLEEDQTTSSGDSETRRKSIYVLRNGKLRLQDNGVSRFEESIAKRVAGMQV